MTAFEILAVVVFLNIAATVELWRRAARRPEKLKKKFRNRFWRDKPITPKHQPPPAPKDGYLVGKAELQFFSDFEDFANVVNWWLADPDMNPGCPWRLQELPKSELSELAWHSPRYGRRYAVFHNQVRLGEIEITNSLEYTTQTPHVVIHIELSWVRLLTCERIRSFLYRHHHACQRIPSGNDRTPSNKPTN